MSWLRTPTMQLSTSDTVMVSSGIFFFSFLSQGLVAVSDLCSSNCPASAFCTAGAVHVCRPGWPVSLGPT